MLGYIQIFRGPPLLPSFELNHVFKDLVSKYHLQRLGLQHRNSRGMYSPLDGNNYHDVTNR